MQDPLLTVHICRLDDIVRCAHNRTECFIFQSFSEDQRHIPRRRIMIIIRKSAGICKMCIGTSDLTGALVHHIDKCLLCPADMLCDLCRNVIGRLDDQSIKTILHSQDFAHLCADITGICRNITHPGLCKGHLLIHGGVLHCHQQGHDLGNAGRISLFISALVIKNNSCVCIHQDTGI